MVQGAVVALVFSHSGESAEYPVDEDLGKGLFPEKEL
jgi:hypothetical protein